MGRGPELLGDLKKRLVIDAIDAPVVAAPECRLYDLVAERYGCDEDYARQIINDLENTGVIYVERDGQIPVAYDIHPAHLRRTDSGWTPTELLAALRDAAGTASSLPRERYDAFPPGGRPPSAVIATTFRSWGDAVLAAGLQPDPSSS